MKIPVCVLGHVVRKGRYINLYPSNGGGRERERKRDREKQRLFFNVDEAAGERASHTHLDSYLYAMLYLACS